MKSAERERAERESAERETADRQTAERETAEREKEKRGGQLIINLSRRMLQKTKPLFVKQTCAISALPNRGL